MASTSEWLHFHQTNPSPPPPSAAITASSADLFWSSSQLSDSTITTTTINSSSSNPNLTGPAQAQQQLGPDGRVAKPARRRTRASRRTPTTLLNTDTTNFRAMVQQFTGGPSTAFGFTTAQAQAQTRWAGVGSGQGLGFAMQFPYGGNDHNVLTTTTRRSTAIDLVQQGAGRGGGPEGNDVVFGNINVGVFPGSSTSENRVSSSNNTTSTTGGFQF